MNKEYASAMKIVTNMVVELDKLNLTTKEGRTVFVNILVQFGMVSIVFEKNRLTPEDFQIFEPVANKIQTFINTYIGE